jgi:hypothetical protein
MTETANNEPRFTNAADEAFFRLTKKTDAAQKEAIEELKRQGFAGDGLLWADTPVTIAEAIHVPPEYETEFKAWQAAQAGFNPDLGYSNDEATSPDPYKVSDAKPVWGGLFRFNSKNNEFVPLDYNEVARWQANFASYNAQDIPDQDLANAINTSWHEDEPVNPAPTPLELFEALEREFLTLANHYADHLNGREIALAKTNMQQAGHWIRDALKHWNPDTFKEDE